MKNRNRIISRGRGPRSSTRWIAVWAMAAAAALPGALVAQDLTSREPFTLFGTVVDENGRPLVGAFVSLSGSDWGSLSDVSGRFRIPDIEPGVWSITAEQLGYETLVWEGDVGPGRSPELRMSPRPIVLEGLTVVADRFETRRRATATSVRTVDRTALVTSAQTSAMDVLLARTSLWTLPCNGVWSNECVFARGRVTEPVVYVDEARVIGGIEYLKSVLPHELYMIEVYGSGRQIRAYTTRFMEQAARSRLAVLPIF